jgi:hypothetical protein
MSTTEPAPAKPAITMGQRPDGSPWVIAVDFGNDVLVDAYGTIRAHSYKSFTVEQARVRAAALLAAAEWVETGQSAAMEAQTS